MIVGLISGIGAGWSKKISYWIQPVTKVLGAIPTTTYMPIVMMLATSMFGGSAFLIGLGVWFPVTVSSMTGVANVPKNYYEAAQTLGTVYCNGEKIIGTSEKRGLVFQDHALFPWLTVWDNVLFGLKSCKKVKEKKELAEQLLDIVGLTRFKKSYPNQLSGGMSQRVALLRALANEPDVLLLDEPLGALDTFTRMNIQDALIDLWKARGNTMILITHDVDEAIYLSQKVIVMSPRPGRIINEINIEMGYPRNRSHSAFTLYRNKILEQLNFAHEESINYYI